MQELLRGLYELTEQVRLVGIPMSILAFAIGGVLIITGGQQQKQMGKSVVISAGIGLAIVGLAPEIIEWLAPIFGL